MTVDNLSTLTLLNILNKTTAAQQKVMERMATGWKINRGADDPAGLIAVTSLDAELTAVDAGISNNQRTDAMLGVADGALAEVGNLVDEIQRPAYETANDSALTAEEIAANQAQIDDAIASIDRIIANTSFNGKKLLDGSLGIRSTIGNAGAVTDVKVFNRRPGSTAETLTVSVTANASQGVLTSVMTTSTAVVTSFSVQGKLGTAVIQVNAGDNVSAVAAGPGQPAKWPGAVAPDVALGHRSVISVFDTGRAVTAARPPFLSRSVTRTAPGSSAAGRRSAVGLRLPAAPTPPPWHRRHATKIPPRQKVARL